MQVVRGDLTQQVVTGIVNPTNSQLSLMGGVSKFILKAAGPRLAKDCKELMTGRGPAQHSLSAGSALVTPCAGYGSIRCQYVIHAAGSHYSGELWPLVLLRALTGSCSLCCVTVFIKTSHNLCRLQLLLLTICHSCWLSLLW